MQTQTLTISYHVQHCQRQLVQTQMLTSCNPGAPPHQGRSLSRTCCQPTRSLHCTVTEQLRIWPSRGTQLLRWATTAQPCSTTTQPCASAARLHAVLTLQGLPPAPSAWSLALLAHQQRDPAAVVRIQIAHKGSTRQGSYT